MSFALEVKEEVVSHSFDFEQEKAFLAGFIKYNGEMIFSNGILRLRLTTISNRIARSLLSFVKHHYTGETEVSIFQTQTLKKNKIFNITLIGKVKEFLLDLGIIDDNFKSKVEVKEEYLNSSTNFRAYVAGMFVAIGSVNSPTTTNYHLELQFKEEADALYFKQVIKKYGFPFKVLKRSENRYIDYVKKSILVSDFLKFIDASRCVMQFENERISRDMVNNINRISNIDISNQSKIIKTGEEQIKKIEYIKKQRKMGQLSEKANVLANIRLKKPDLSYAELQDEMSKKGYEITKSGIANLFKNIDKLYSNLIDENQKK
ncbi:DNA-binding protein WhiA [Mesoplasma lactucae]|uniref:Probable cell division protein WhiA n=1 Tax=Mesoplasma lactucae ATCC 49193 TaxID=81460 RepID=A0A291ISG6_9MOLU|nr:DNA-binding protein WhiA [Mesoplasma lactucae]ATG97637.1 DNA-binding protein WhiA [Mesoplasma lactucae ATCC 49193]ATZ19901.1 DNA-binding protein WhiA [Mesoplasma lactucae ATCC 49193]MCL8216764.1 putative sporulation transcription regulator WhiA [Mesoplasma lactucae ATCC 49193]